MATSQRNARNLISAPNGRGGAVARFAQAALLLALALLIWFAVRNAAYNMRAHGIPTDFSFWNSTAGFNVDQTLIPFSAARSTYGDAFFVGLLNTLLVAVIGIVFATLVGLLIGLGRLSSNFMIARLSGAYVETIRNIPLLLQLLFWYNAVLKPLPSPRQSIDIFGFAFLNNRGLILPSFVFSDGAGWIAAALLLALLIVAAVHFRRRRVQEETGRRQPLGLVVWLIVLLPATAFLVTGRPISFDAPVLRGFNFVGGVRVLPEFVALTLGLSLYTAAFIAEIVRGGILAVERGQEEAALALGLRRSQTMRLVVLPQAMRIVAPPLTNQYLNLTKNSSLAVFIGYPDLVQVFAGTVLNQTGAAIQVIGVTMAVYLLISLVISLLMSVYNRRVALQER